MTTVEQLDHRARDHYREAAAALSPGMQGRLRAARRTALAGPPARTRRARPLAMPIAAMVAAVIALALGLRLQAPDHAEGDVIEHGVAPVAGGGPSSAQRSPAPQDSDDDMLLSMLDEDPDFYLWLDSDNPLPATLEQRHDPS